MTIIRSVESIKLDVSVVVTLFNEEESIAHLVRKVEESLSGKFSWELILVDDGSTDQTRNVAKAEVNEQVKLMVLSRNFGQTSAMAAGIERAQGKYIVTMDGDLQNDPSDIPKMIAQLEEKSVDIIAGRRANRKDGFILRKLPSKIANYFIRKMTKVRVSDYGCSLKVFRRETAKQLELYGELHRFIPVLANVKGARIGEVDVKHHARKYGQSKYGLGRTLRVSSDLVFVVFLQKYLQRPMHFFGSIGFLSLFVGLAVNLYLLVLKAFGHDIWGRPLLILGLMAVVAGIQFLTFGLLGELLVRTYFQSKGERAYMVREVFEA